MGTTVVVNKDDSDFVGIIRSPCNINLDPCKRKQMAVDEHTDFMRALQRMIWS